MDTLMKLVNNTVLDSERNLCFVNTAIQLLHSIPSVKQFFKDKEYLPLGEETKMPICDDLSRLFRNKTQTVSTAVLRSLVGQASGKHYLWDGSQQDTAEFFTILLQQVDEEILVTNLNAKLFIERFWGSEKTERRFLNNIGGKCPVCKALPRVEEESFNILRLHIPDTERVVTVESILENYYQENTDNTEMKCSNCCEKTKHGPDCSLTGNCKLRSSCLKKLLVRGPEFLILQIDRFASINGIKINTTVDIGS
jgi:ubiquitin C-terminal hydrolase